MIGRGWENKTKLSVNNEKTNRISEDTNPIEGGV